MTIHQSRRTFIKIAAGTGVGLIIGVEFPLTWAKAATPPFAPNPFAPNPFVRVAPDNTVTVLIKHLDKGRRRSRPDSRRSSRRSLTRTD